MNAKNSIVAENELVELTDTELESVCGGLPHPGIHVHVYDAFNAASNNQSIGYSNGSLNQSPVNFGELTSNTGGLQVGGASNGGNFYNSGVNYPF